MKEREHALQSLDLAYHKYKEITRNLDEGLKVDLTSTVASAVSDRDCSPFASSTMTLPSSCRSSERAARNGSICGGTRHGKLLIHECRRVA